MTSNKIANAKGLYLEGIRDGDIDRALDRYTGARYTQHSTGVGDGKAGFKAFFEPFLARNPERDIRVLRAIEDGSHVFVHVYQSLNGGAAQWVTADLFDTDDRDRMIEHWDVIAPFGEPNPAGHSMIDGPTAVEDLDRGPANRALVARFVDEVLVAGQLDRLPNYLAGEQYIEHAAGMSDGLAAWRAHREALRAEGMAPHYHRVHRLIGQGNFAVAYSHVQRGKSHFAVFDLFRVAAGAIAEHWAVEEKILPPEQWNNSGKF